MKTFQEYNYIDWELKIFLCNVYFQVFLRAVVLWYYHSDFVEILHQRKHFWKIEGKSTGEVESLLKKTSRFFRLFYVSSILCAVVMTITALKSKRMPFDIYIPNERYINYNTLFPTQMLFLHICLNGIIGFDSFFMAFCMNTTAQLKLLGQAFSQIDFRDENQMKTCLLHHIFLIEHVSKLRKVFSAFLLFQLLNDTVEIFMEIYASTDG